MRDLAEDEVTLLGEVEQPAGRADDDVDALAQRLDLRLVRAAAVDREHARAELRARRVLRSPATWTASSRVGAMTSACGAAAFPPGRSSRLSSGTPKPSVLPVPVRAWPIRSWPASAIGRVISWIAKVLTMPTSASASTISGRTSKSAEGRAVLAHGRPRGQRCGVLVGDQYVGDGGRGVEVVLGGVGHAMRSSQAGAPTAVVPLLCACDRLWEAPH